MGHQQLLLLVLGTIIVGLAIVAGTQILEKNYRQNDADLLLDRSIMIAQSAIAWKAQADPYVGGNASYSGLEDGGFRKLFLGEETIVGYFQITKAVGDSLVLSSVSKKYPEVGVRVHVVGEEFVKTDIQFDGSVILF